MRASSIGFLAVLVGCQTTGRDASRVSEFRGPVTAESCSIEGSDDFLRIYRGEDFAVLSSVAGEPPTIVTMRADGTFSGQIREPASSVTISMVDVFQRKVRVIRDAVRATEPEDSPARRWVEANVLEVEQIEAKAEASALVLVELDHRGRPIGTFSVNGGDEFQTFLKPPFRIHANAGIAVTKFPLKARFGATIDGQPVRTEDAPRVVCGAPAPVEVSEVPRATLPTTAEGKRLTETMHMTAAAAADLAVAVGYLSAGKVDDERVAGAARLFCSPFKYAVASGMTDGKDPAKLTTQFLGRHPGFGQFRQVMGMALKSTGTYSAEALADVIARSCTPLTKTTASNP